MTETVLKYYKSPGLSPIATEVILSKLRDAIPRLEIVSFSTETCFYVGLEGKTCLHEKDAERLKWILSDSFEEDKLSAKSYLSTSSEEHKDGVNTVIEIGPRLNFSTAWSTNAVSICHSIGLNEIQRLECSLRYKITTKLGQEGAESITKNEEDILVGKLHDRMTQCRYVKPLCSFAIDVKPEDCYEVDVMTEGRKALEKVNKDLGLAFDEWDIEYYTKLFTERVGRSPTSVECFDLAQSNSEHSRHWFFKGKMIIDGEEKEDNLFQIVMKTQEKSNGNNVIKFSDNSSAIQGYKVSVLCPEASQQASRYDVMECLRHIIFTAETHNFPTGVAPFSGATTGTGGRIRDVQSTGQGAHVVAGTAGYSVGNLHIPGYKLPWENDTFTYPGNFALPLDIIIEASNGASDYGNKFGEPVLTGFARSFGVQIPCGERREWVKPIMFSGGIGMMDGGHVTKTPPEKGMEVVKVGGPVFRIGVGGGAASSIQVQGDNESELDFGAVQRGDAEMEQKLNRAIRACIEMGENNPICSIHDQGAGGNGNVLKEISEPAGAVIHVKNFTLGDPTLSVMEIWGAEYQESNALLVRSEHAQLLRDICEREKVPVDFVGSITGDGKIVLEHEVACTSSGHENGEVKAAKRKKNLPVDLELDVVLGKMPQKVFKMEREEPILEPLLLDDTVTVKEALDRVLRLPSVGSKRFLTNKVDRSVTGLIAQQQCVGPLHTPISDVAVISLSHFNTHGSATAIGEQPIKGLVDAGCGARMSVGEALTNLVFARISNLKDVKCSGNWMYAAKLPGEGAALYDACVAMSDVMSQLGIAVDGGKDSLSMAARVGTETVKAPGTLVVSAYAPCPDVTATVTPDLKSADVEGVLLYVTPCLGKARLGGSALAQVYKQIGKVSPDMDDPKVFEQLFITTQELLEQRIVLSGHDVSDGGLVTALLEMAFAGNCGMNVDILTQNDIDTELKHPQSKPLSVLFAEELGIVLEVHKENVKKVLATYKASNVPCQEIGHTCGVGSNAVVSIAVDSEVVITEKMVELRDVWEATSFQLERLQANPQCIKEDEEQLKHRHSPKYNLTFDPQPTDVTIMESTDKPKVAIIREEGSNGDREMAASLQMAGFEVWDVNMYDLGNGKVTLDDFRGVVFVGGFSYADVLGSAKGWAATALFNPSVRTQFDTFFSREDTFSLGVCNGCQLMAQLGWMGCDPNNDDQRQGVYLARNTSERFESRFVSVKVNKTPSLMLKGMEGSVIGIWVAHGEGRFQFKREDIHNSIQKNGCIPFQYTDDDGAPTMQYPLNPNGSPDGMAGLCSRDGRHLAMMPHPERCTLLWQWPWMPQEWKKTLKASPWLQMFQNAYRWCMDN